MVIFAALLAGMLMYAAFAPLALWWSAPLAFALLIYVLHEPRLARRLISVTVFASAFFAPLLSWSSTYVGNIPWIILAILQILLLLPISFLKFRREKPWLLLLFPSAWLLMELMRTRFPFGGFGWGRTAFSQADAPYAVLARLGGAPLLSFTVAFLGVALYLLVSGHRTTALAIVLLISIPAFLLASSPASQKRDFSFLAVQGGVPELGLGFNARATVVFENHLKVTRAYLDKHKNMPDVILWPENSVDVDPFRIPFVKDQIQELADTYSIPVILGAVLQKGNNFQNASILWMPKTGPRSTYIKEHLTPFGEYIPIRPIAELISPYARAVRDFLPGQKIVVHHVGRAVFAPLICFELLDDRIGRAMALQSNAFVIQTNSATFGTSPESEQQLEISRVRSIEHNRFSMSISTSGVSALIDPNGRVTHRTGLNRPAVIDASIALVSSRTLSDRYGQQIELALIFLPSALLLGAIPLIRTRIKGRKGDQKV